MPPLSTLLSRGYAVRALPFEVVTSDGVRLRGHRLGEGGTALVVCHGFVGWHRKRRLVEFQESLARWFTVYAFDFRGHGDSEGLSSLGLHELHDVAAVVARAREDGFERVVTLGGSMGGIAVIRHAALLRGVDCVIAVSAPGAWTGHDTRPMRRIMWLLTSRLGRLALLLSGIRTTDSWEEVATPAEVAALVSPTPLVIVHGRDDAFFDEEQARLLYDSAAPPKLLLLATRFGHAEDGYDRDFAKRVKALVERFVPGALDPETSVSLSSSRTFP